MCNACLLEVCTCLLAKHVMVSGVNYSWPTVVCVYLCLHDALSGPAQLGQIMVPHQEENERELPTHVAPVKPAILQQTFWHVRTSPPLFNWLSVRWIPSSRLHPLSSMTGPSITTGDSITVTNIPIPSINDLDPLGVTNNSLLWPSVMELHTSQVQYFITVDPS